MDYPSEKSLTCQPCLGNFKSNKVSSSRTQISCYIFTFIITILAKSRVRYFKRIRRELCTPSKTIIKIINPLQSRLTDAKLFDDGARVAKFSAR